MRVSNTVKDYIRHELEKKYPTGNLPEFDALLEAYFKFDDELGQKIDALIHSEFSAFVDANPRADGMSINRTTYSTPTCRYSRIGFLYGTKLDEDNKIYVKSMREKREAAFEKIVATLELGGNKDDLERMLAELD